MSRSDKYLHVCSLQGDFDIRQTNVYCSCNYRVQPSSVNKGMSDLGRLVGLYFI